MIKTNIITCDCQPYWVLCFLANTKILMVVLYGLLEITKTSISVAEIAISSSFSGPVPYLFRNTKMLMVVLYGLLEITKTS